MLELVHECLCRHLHVAKVAALQLLVGLPRQPPGCLHRSMNPIVIIGSMAKYWAGVAEASHGASNVTQVSSATHGGWPVSAALDKFARRSKLGQINIYQGNFPL